MIEIKELNKKQLQQFIDSEEFNKLNHLPISRHRAISHIHNPRAQEDDILLFLVYDKTQMIGYLGTLPDTMNYKGVSERFAWLSCLWINPEYRGQKVALKLVQASLKEWNKKILATEFTAAAKKLYDKTDNFTTLKINKGIRIYSRLDLQTILPPKKAIFSQIKPLLKIIDYSLNSLFDLRFSLSKNTLKSTRIEVVDNVDTELGNFISENNKNTLFKRSLPELEWMLKFPWILTASTQSIESQKYHFSSLDKRFDFIPIKVYNNDNKLVAFLIFSRRNNHLKLVYCFYQCEKQIIVDVINYYIREWKINTFTTFNQKISDALGSTKTPSLYKKSISRTYIKSSFLDDHLLNQDFEIQDGDGDCAFT